MLESFRNNGDIYNSHFMLNLVKNLSIYTDFNIEIKNSLRVIYWQKVDFNTDLVLELEFNNLF